MHPNEALFANEAFYLAFAQADYDAMQRVWAEQGELICIHPGWAAITKRDEILASWRGILGNEQQPAVTCYGARAVSMGDCVAVVCYEEVAGSVLVAINVFVEEGGRPRMVQHQSGPCGSPPEKPSRDQQLDG